MNRDADEAEILAREFESRVPGVRTLEERERIIQAYAENFRVTWRYAKKLRERFSRHSDPRKE